jgi:hypothetical protein
VNGYTAASIIAIGTALIALWTYFRFPSLTPADFFRVVLHWIVSMVALHLIPPALAAANGSPRLVFLALFLVVIPLLTYMFLAMIWLMTMLQDRMRGAVR